MRHAMIGLAALLGGCATVTFNGQDVARAGAASAIVAIAAAILLAEDGESADQHQRCPSCPPSTIEE